MTKDSSGNVVLPKWVVTLLVGFSGLGTGGSAVSAYKVDAVTKRLEQHEAKPSHDSVLGGGPWKIVMDEFERARVERHELKAAVSAIEARLAGIEAGLAEARRPR